MRKKGKDERQIQQKRRGVKEERPVKSWDACVCVCVRCMCLIINLIFIQGEDLNNLAFQFYSTYFTIT